MGNRSCWDMSDARLGCYFPVLGGTWVDYTGDVDISFINLLRKDWFISKFDKSFAIDHLWLRFFKLDLN